MRREYAQKTANRFEFEVEFEFAGHRGGQAQREIAEIEAIEGGARAQAQGRVSRLAPRRPRESAAVGYRPDRARAVDLTAFRARTPACHFPSTKSVCKVWPASPNRGHETSGLLYSLHQINSDACFTSPTSATREARERQNTSIERPADAPPELDEAVVMRGVFPTNVLCSCAFCPHDSRFVLALHDVDAFD